MEFSPKGWLDLVGEATLGYTKQTDDVDSIELTPRIGARFHLFSRDLPTASGVRLIERPPTRRVVIRDLVRVEYRTLFYTGEGNGTDTAVRFRNRLELLVPLNKPKLTDDGAHYLLTDWEWFVPLDDVHERFANKQRIRTGLGFRPSTAWRFEALYIWTRSRNTASEGFSTSDNIIDIRVKRVF